MLLDQLTANWLAAKPCPARPRTGYRLFDQREELVRRLTEDVKANKDWLLETLQYPLAVR